MKRALFVCLLILLALGASHAAQTYLSRDAFIDSVFTGNPPEPKAIWLIGELRKKVADLLGHPPQQMRERYWYKNGRSAWILEEIGKERPITVGWVVSDKGIQRTTVLIYRESRGYEIRYDFFTQQFQGIELTEEQQLNRNINGISGATLSVHAMRRMARLALFLHQQVSPPSQNDGSQEDA